MAKSKAKTTKKSTGDKSRSEAIAKSWRNPKIRKARTKRDAVEAIDKKGRKRQFRSVSQAFEQLGLGGGMHSFRKQLKAAGRLKHESSGTRFRIVEH